MSSSDPLPQAAATAGSNAKPASNTAPPTTQAGTSASAGTRAAVAASAGAFAQAQAGNAPVLPSPVAGSSGSSPSAAGSGAAGMPATAAGSGASGAGSVELMDECGVVPSTASQAAKPKAVVMYGLVEYHTADDNEFVGIHGVLSVPAKPPPTGVIFVWPGTQTFPDSADYQPVGGGVLQPVLTWGQSCVPGALPGHDTWWISPVYVNEDSSIPALAGCHGGPVIKVDVGDKLDLDMRLSGTVWEQKVIDLDSKKSTEFKIDLRGQKQPRALFWIELKTAAKPIEDMIFEKVVLTTRDPDPKACQLNNAGMNDYVSQARASADGRHCCIDHIILRAEGVAATSKNP